MLIWFYGTTMVLGALLANEDGEPQDGAAVTYEIRDRANTPVLSGTLAPKAGTPGAYEDRVDASEILADYDGDEETMRGLLYRARVVALQSNGVRAQASPRIHLQHNFNQAA